MKDNRQTKYPILTKENIIKILDECPADGDYHFAVQFLYMLIYNDKYDPEHYSQEIHDKIKDNYRSGLFQFLLDSRNISEEEIEKEYEERQKWYDNEGKDKPLKLVSVIVTQKNINNKWTYNHEDNINRIMKYDNIVKLFLPSQDSKPFSRNLKYRHQQ